MTAQGSLGQARVGPEGAVLASQAPFLCGVEYVGEGTVSLAQFMFVGSC